MKGLFLDVGECIYCGEKSSQLTREHVLPRALGGSWAPNGHPDAIVLQRASCRACQDTTQAIENDCMRSMDVARKRLGMKSKDADETACGTGDRPDGSSEVVQLAWSQLPAIVTVPQFYKAGALNNSPLQEVAPCDYKFLKIASAEDPAKLGYTRVGVRMKCDSKSFARMLAKVALGMAVAKYGVSGFVPLVRRLIVSAPEEYGRWVGGYAGTGRVDPPSSSLHEVGGWVTDRAQGSLIIVELRLFAEFGGPTNYVVVGKMR
jgi:HNH endonuclease